MDAQGRFTVSRPGRFTDPVDLDVPAGQQARSRDAATSTTAVGRDSAPFAAVEGEPPVTRSLIAGVPAALAGAQIGVVLVDVTGTSAAGRPVNWRRGGAGTVVTRALPRRRIPVSSAVSRYR